MPLSLSRALAQPDRPQRLSLAALGGLSVLLLAACGGGGADRPATAPPPSAPPPAGALAVSAPGELLNYVRERVRQRGATGSWAGGFGLPTGSPLREPLNAAILQMREDGTLERTLQSWLGNHE